MTEFLLLTLYAPLASWGDIAVGEVRGSWDRPSRSAVLGLVAAALGVDRADQAAHDALDVGYGVAVRQDAAGAPPWTTTPRRQRSRRRSKRSGSAAPGDAPHTARPAQR